MREDFRPTVTVRLGDDGNPEINIDGTTMQAQQLCVALGGGLIFSVAVMLADSKHYEHSAQKQQQTTVKTSNERKAG